MRRGKSVKSRCGFKKKNEMPTEQLEKKHASPSRKKKRKEKPRETPRGSTSPRVRMALTTWKVKTMLR